MVFVTIFEKELGPEEIMISWIVEDNNVIIRYMFKDCCEQANNDNTGALYSVMLGEKTNITNT